MSHVNLTTMLGLALTPIFRRRDPGLERPCDLLRVTKLVKEAGL